MLNTMQKMELEALRDDWLALFRQLDVDNDGLIPVRELYAAVNESASCFGLSSEQRDILLDGVDANLDNHIDVGEWFSLMTRAKRWHLRRLMTYAARSVLHKRSQPRSLRYLINEYNCLPPPVFMALISTIQIAIYLYYALDSREWSAVGPVPIQSVLILNPNNKAQVWRLFTYQFIHIGYTHLITNVVVQILLGIPLELVSKFWRIGALYLGGVFGGALLVMAVDPNVYLGGASGAAYALLSAHASDLVLNWAEMQFHWLRAAILALLVTVDLGVAVYQRYFAAIINKTSYVSHLGGAIAGLLLGVVLLRNLKWKKWEVYVWWSCLVGYVFFVFVCLVIIYSPKVF